MNIIKLLMAPAAIISAQEHFGGNSFHTCDPNEPLTCSYSTEGGCCMTYKLLEAPGDLDKDWDMMEVGDLYHDCVSFHEMDFLYEFGKGKHSVYENNKFYYEHVDKREFWGGDPTPADLEMTFEAWWDRHKSDFKGLSDWKDTKYTLDCREKGDNMANIVKVGLSFVVTAAAYYM